MRHYRRLTGFVLVLMPVAWLALLWLALRLLQPVPAGVPDPDTRRLHSLDDLVPYRRE